ncbi:MAG: amidohydrolase family protein [Bacilli bacterium]
MLIDFHAHLKRDMITKVYDLEDCLNDMMANKIDKRVISTLEGKSITEQNNYIIDIVKKYPDKLIGCAVINPKLDDCVEEMKRLAKYPNEIKVIEFNTWDHGYLPERYEYHLNQIFDIVQKNGLPVKIFSGWGARSMPQQWAKYLKKYPNIKFVILHIGGIDFGYGAIDFIRDMPNAMSETSDQTEIQVLHKAFAQLKPEKLLFGSNYPEQITKCSINTFDVLNLSEECRDAMFYKTATSLLKL